MVAAVKPQENVAIFALIDACKICFQHLTCIKLLRNDYWFHYPLHICCLKYNLHNLTKYQHKGTSKY